MHTEQPVVERKQPASQSVLGRLELGLTLAQRRHSREQSERQRQGQGQQMLVAVWGQVQVQRL